VRRLKNSKTANCGLKTLNATKAAVEEGIVPGGGTTLIHLTRKSTRLKNSLDNEEKIELSLKLSQTTMPAEGSVIA